MLGLEYSPLVKLRQYLISNLQIVYSPQNHEHILFEAKSFKMGREYRIEHIRPVSRRGTCGDYSGSGKNKLGSPGRTRTYNLAVVGPKLRTNSRNFYNLKVVRANFASWHFSVFSLLLLPPSLTYQYSVIF